MPLLVLMNEPCRTCGSQDAKLVDDDHCLERFLDAGGEQDDYDPVEHCEHFECVRCGSRFDA